MHEQQQVPPLRSLRFATVEMTPRWNQAWNL